MMQDNKYDAEDLRRLVDTPELDVVRLVCLDSKGCVLLVEEADDPNWKLPGGKIHENESILDAIKREAEEELGVDVQEQMIMNYVKAFIPDSANFRHIVKVNLRGVTLKVTDEVAHFGYFSLDNLPETKFAKHITSATQLLSN